MNKCLNRSCKCLLLHLSFPVDSNNSTSSIMRCSHKDSITTYSVHVDTRTALNIIQMNITILGDQENNAMFFTHLADLNTIYKVVMFSNILFSKSFKEI